MRKFAEKVQKSFYFYLSRIVIGCWKRKSNRRSEEPETTKSNNFTSKRILQK